MNLNLENISKAELIELLKIQNSVNKIQEEIVKIRDEKIEFQESKIKHLEFQIKELQRLVFGTKRERFEAVNNPFQLTLPFDVAENTTITETVKEKISYEREKATKREHPGRLPLPAHLPEARC